MKGGLIYIVRLIDRTLEVYQIQTILIYQGIKSNYSKVLTAQEAAASKNVVGFVRGVLVSTSYVDVGM